MTRILFFLLLTINSIIALGQTTYNPTIQSRNNNATITKVTLTSTETIIYITVPKSKQWGGWVRFSSATVLVPCEDWNINDARKSDLSGNIYPVAGYESLYADAVRRLREGRQIMSDNGWLIRSLGPDQLDTKYKATKSETHFELHFDRVPVGKEYLFLRELDRDGGWEWYGIRINNPYPTVENLGYTENSIKSTIDQQNDGIVGIYQGLTQTDNQYTLGCVKHNGVYKFVYLNSKEDLPHWKSGDVKATLTPTAVPTTFKMDWNMADKSSNDDCYVIFEGASMKAFVSGDEEGYIKMYPTSNSSNIGGLSAQEWSGSGFALKNGYIATNYHVVENARNITVQGIKGSFSTEYKATVVATDKFNDLAIIKISDSRFSGFGTTPYRVKTSTSEVGEEVFVLGYPLTSTMGDEIKLTTGVVSSKTGFQGDVSLYQISAPIQPGNSGGPLFDGNGNLIGIVNAKHKGAENVGYAIKASYLNNLVESAVSSNILPSINSVSSQPLTNKVKNLRNFVFMIKCSSSQ